MASTATVLNENDTTDGHPEPGVELKNKPANERGTAQLQVDDEELQHSTDVIDDARMIHLKLKELYKDVKLPTVSWMAEELSNLLTDQCFNQLELDRVFDKVYEPKINPSRILIGHEQVCGKTTFAHKIIRDWAMGEDYVSHFEFAILINLRSLKNQSIQDFVREIIKIQNGTGCDTWEIINSDKTLLIFDGINEIESEDPIRQDVTKILHDRFKYKMVVLLLCKAWSLEYNEEYMTYIDKGKTKSRVFWDKKIVINGIRVGSLVQCILGETTTHTEKIVALINGQFNIVLLINSPLFLILVDFIIQRNPQVAINTKIDLLKYLIDFVIDQSVEKNERTNFSIFNEYREIFCKLGNMALDHIAKNDWCFECNDDTKRIYEIGLFTKYEYPGMTGESSVHFEAFDTNLLEFAAAFSIWQTFLKNGKKLPRNLVTKINQIFMTKTYNSPLIQFLFGLVGKDIKPLLCQFLEYSALYSGFASLLEQILPECEISEDLHEVISKFIPIHLGVFSTHLFTNNPVLSKLLVKFSISCNLNISDSHQQNHPLTDPLNVKIFEIYFDTWDKVNVIPKGTKCEHLVLHFAYGFPEFDISKFEGLKSIVSIPFNYIHVRITKQVSLKRITDYVNNKLFDNVIVDFLYCEMTCGQSEPELITNLLRLFKFRHLSLHLGYLCEARSSFVYDIAVLPDLNSMCIYNGSGFDIELDLNTITGNGSKYWKLLKFIGFRVKCSKSFMKSNCIDSLEISKSEKITLEADENVLLSLTPRHLSINNEILRSMLSKLELTSWCGWKSVVELTLIFDRSFCELIDFSQLHRLINLQILRLRVEFHSELVESSIVKSLQELSFVHQLEIEWVEGRDKIHERKPNKLHLFFDNIKDIISSDEFKKIQNVVVTINERALPCEIVLYRASMTSLLFLVERNANVCLRIVECASGIAKTFYCDELLLIIHYFQLIAKCVITVVFGKLMIILVKIRKIFVFLQLKRNCEY